MSKWRITVNASKKGERNKPALSVIVSAVNNVSFRVGVKQHAWLIMKGMGETGRLPLFFCYAIFRFFGALSRFFLMSSSVIPLQSSLTKDKISATIAYFGEPNISRTAFATALM